MIMHFDTLDYATTLEGAGITRAHAEVIAKVQAKALAELVANDLVTKDFLCSELTQVDTRLSRNPIPTTAERNASYREDWASLHAYVHRIEIQGVLLALAVMALIIADRFVK